VGFVDQRCRGSQKRGVNHRVAYAVLLDENGNKFQEFPDYEEIATLSYRCNGEKCEVRRNGSEDAEAFLARAQEVASAALEPTVMLDLYIGYI
jgi:hypothetical protein